MFNTGVIVPAGTFRITIRTSDAYEARAAAVEPYEQVFALIGGVATTNTTDLVDGTIEASATSDVGVLTTQGGELLVLHATERIGPTFEANGVSIVGIDVTPIC